MHAHCLPIPTAKRFTGSMEECMADIRVSSDAFVPGGRIPREHTCEGQDLSPPIAWSNVPDGARSLLLIVEDEDAPRGIFTHWLIFNMPPDTRRLEENVPRRQRLSDGSVQGRNDFGTVGYRGPCPPPGKPHRFYFRVYALDTLLDLAGNEGRARFMRAMEGHVLARGEVMGIYGR
ncbi:MAG: YbhB/YbcL family Raf kinase inhibitor-like protein [Methanomicrobiales archaeon]|nr:YbhB/YbcL family Raf kinase inhibitor-like protein [Methanomicrobiales archaeon]